MKPAIQDRSAPPPPGEIRPFRFPPFIRHTFASGFGVYAARLSGVPLVSLELLGPAGALHDPPGSAGLATLTGALLDEGTRQHSAMEIALSVERLGGHLTTGADWDVGYVSSSLLAKDGRAGIELLAELATQPSFPEAEIERLRRQRLADILRRSHSPAALADDQLSRAIYTGTVYAGSPFGTGASVAGLDRAKILEFYQSYYALSGFTLIAVGELEPEALLGELGAIFGGAEATSERPAGSRSPKADPAAASQEIRPRPLPGIMVHVVDRPGAAQTELRLGHAGVPRTHPDFPILGMMNTLLGGKFTSRINLNLRERHAFTYGASSRFTGRLGPGPFSVSTAVATESAGAAVREVLAELRRIREGLVEIEEMEETRSYLLGVFPYTLQTIDDLARRLEDLAVYGLPDDYFHRFAERITAISREDILRVSRQHLDPEHIAVVAVGPAETLRAQLEELGPVALHTAQEVEAVA